MCRKFLIAFICVLSITNINALPSELCKNLPDSSGYSALLILPTNLPLPPYSDTLVFNINAVFPNGYTVNMTKQFLEQYSSYGICVPDNVFDKNNSYVKITITTPDGKQLFFNDEVNYISNEIICSGTGTKEDGLHCKISN